MKSFFGTDGIRGKFNNKAIYSDNCRVYIRPTGTEAIMRAQVEAKNHRKVFYQAK